MAFALEFQPARRVGDSFIFIVAAVDCGFCAAPALVDDLVSMHHAAVDIEAGEWLFRKLASLGTRRPKDEVVAVPFAEAGVELIGRVGFCPMRA